MNLSKCILTAVILIFSGLLQAAPVESIDLSTWEQKGVTANGSWKVSSDGTSVSQSLNGNPTFFVSPNEMINTTIRGSIRVSDKTDDDLIGFVLGYKSPDSSVNDMNFILFDWKKATQSASGYTSQAGFTLSDVNGTFTNYAPNFWGHKETAGFDVLATNYGDNLGWQVGTTYDFEILYQENRITINVSGGQFGAGQTIFDIEGGFSAGQFGFYNYSQAGVQYWSFSEQKTPLNVPEPGGLALIGFGIFGLMMVTRKSFS